MFGYFGLLEPYVNAHKIVEEDHLQNRGALWLGDLQSALDKVQLKQRGIKTIVSVVSGIDVRYDKDPNFVHRIFWAHDSPNFDISQYFEETFQVIEDGLSRGSVLVHCVMGISRSASIVIAFLMKKFNQGYAFTYNYVKKRRVIISPNYGFSYQLKEFDQQLRSGILLQQVILKGVKETIKQKTDFQNQTNLPIIQKEDSKFFLMPVHQQALPQKGFRPKKLKTQNQNISSVIKSRNMSFDLEQNTQDSIDGTQDVSPILESTQAKSFSENKKQLPGLSDFSLQMKKNHKLRQLSQPYSQFNTPLPQLNIVTFKNDRSLVIKPQIQNEDFLVQGKLQQINRKQ